jgi:hypothetical protein
MQQSGSNVIANGSGTLNISALSFAFDGTDDSFVDPNDGNLIIGPRPSPHIAAFSGLSAAMSLGTGLYTAAKSGSGMEVGLDTGYAPGSRPPVLYVPFGYVSGAALSNSATWNNQTLRDCPPISVTTWRTA